MSVRFGINTVIDTQFKQPIEAEMLADVGKALDKQFPGHDVTVHFEQTPAPQGYPFGQQDEFFRVRIETPNQPDITSGPRMLIGLRSFPHVLNLADFIGTHLARLKGQPYNTEQLPQDFLDIRHSPR